MPKTHIGFARAFDLMMANVRPLAPEERRLADSLAVVAAEDVRALVDAPSVSSSLKDGYALQSADIGGASPDKPVRLALEGVAAAGAADRTRVRPGAAVRILTGGRIPRQADCVVAEEFTRVADDGIAVVKATGAGRNILPKGADLSIGETLVRTGERLTPGRLGLIAAGGHSHVRVYRNPRVAIIATGDEIRLPGVSLAAGQLYASNAVTLEAWCRRYNCGTTLALVPDQREAIISALRQAIETHDVILTSGGAWSGERDLVRQALEALGWRMAFHRVRLGPGKGTGMGMVDQCPVFMLPGGPPSNLAGFLKLALPAIIRMGGQRAVHLPRHRVRLREEVRGQREWTQVVFGTLASDKDGRRLFQPDRQTSRLKAMGQAQGLLTIPEDVERIAAGSPVQVELLT